ncbi:MAG: class I SAM-dependent methyltransferase [Syntrophobacteraceae bacterium]
MARCSRLFFPKATVGWRDVAIKTSKIWNPRISDELVALLEPNPAPLSWPPSRLGVESAWYDQVAFAHWLVSSIGPGVLVELGTYNGVSYASFCEAVTRKGLPAACFAVDTWKGDEQTGFYGEEVYEDLVRFNSSRYSPFSVLVRSAFDDALPDFEDGSIDLLHIDGLHTYDCARHDFESWLPKLSDRAVVLLHATNLRERGFGIGRLFLELSLRYPTFELLHGHGLGVVAVGADAPVAVSALCSLSGVSLGSVRERFSCVGRRWGNDGRAGAGEQPRIVPALQLVRGLRARADSFSSRVESLKTERFEPDDVQGALEKDCSRVDCLADRIEALTMDLASGSVGWICGWNQYEAARQVWKQYRKKQIQRHEALEIIQDTCCVRSFFVLYPLYEALKPFVKIWRKLLARRAKMRIVERASLAPEWFDPVLVKKRHSDIPADRLDASRSYVNCLRAERRFGRVPKTGSYMIFQPAAQKDGRRSAPTVREAPCEGVLVDSDNCELRRHLDRIKAGLSEALMRERKNLGG